MSAPRKLYDELKDNCFRVIEIVKTEPEFEIRLHSYSDDNHPNYSALSYAWGSEVATELIKCNEEMFEVTPHLKEGLRQLHAQHAGTKLWVDAICINQQSHVEKEQQVSKMHHIYRKADRVIVWLGKEGGSDEVLKAMNGITLPPDRKYSKEEIFERLLGYRSKAEQLFDVGLFKPVAALSRRSWFYRLWTAQEYFYGKSIQFLCGNEVVEGAKLVSLLQKLSIYSFGNHEPSGFLEENNLFAGYAILRELEKIKKEHHEKEQLSFFDFVMIGRTRFAKEPVDRIYAMFGMTENLDRIYSKELPLDYSEESKREYWRLFTRFGKIALQHEPNLRLLSYVNSEERPSQLPSWCPNLASPAITAEIDETTVFAAGWPWIKHQQSLRNLQSPISACCGHPNYKGYQKAHVRVSPGSDTVSIWGASLGRVTSLGPPMEWDSNVDTEDIASVQPLARNLLKWLILSEKSCSALVTSAKEARSLWGNVLVKQTNPSRRVAKEIRGGEGTFEHVGSHVQIEEPKTPILGSSSSDNAPAKSESEEDHVNEKDEDSVYLLLVSILMQILELDPNLDWKEQDAQLLQDFQAVFIWITSFDQSWQHRVLFIVEDKYVGFASEDTEIGDTVCMLYGGPIMYALRQNGTRYQFVSDAYVYECMNGEIFEKLDQGLIQEVVFDIF